MLRLRTLSWLVIGSAIFSTVAPALPAYAASPAAVTSPLSQKVVADHIAEIRKGDPDLEDDFSSDASLFDTSYDGTTSSYMKSGQLRISVDEENTLAWSTLNQDVADFYMEVDTTQDEGSLDNQYGILARMDEDGNYYLFAASSDGYFTIQARVDDEWTPLVDWTETDVINQGEGGENTLGVLAEGDTYTFLINDTIVDDIKDDGIVGKSIALNAAAFGDPPVEIGFDNFRLWYVGEQAPPEVRQAPVDGRNITPEAQGTGEATSEATEEATVEPTEESTPEPTEEATEEAIIEPTDEPTEEATGEATVEPTEEVTEEPTEEATVEPTEESQGTSADPAIAAIQAQPATFSDDFKDGDGSDWIPYQSDSVDYEVADGALQFTFSEPNVLTWSQPPVNPTNFYIEADATVASGVEAAEYGIIFNYVDSQNFYLFAVNNAGRFSVWRLVNNAWETVSDWEDSSALQSGEGNANRLGLLVQDKHITLTANDEVLTDIDNDEAASGAVALAAGTFDEADLTMQFDNVKIWDLDAQEAVPTDEATDEATVEPTEEPTSEPTDEATAEPTEEAQDFSDVTERIADITANDPDIVDDFRRDTGVWDTTTDDNGSSYYESRAFNIEAHATERIVWSATKETADATEPLQFDDFYAEFETTFITYTGENASGLVFRLVDNENFFKFLVDESGYFQLQKRFKGKYSDVIEWALTDAEDTSEGAVNKIGVLAEGSTLSFSVNGTVVAQAEDSDLASGAIALAIQTYATPEGHSTFDNFKLWQLNQ